MNALNRPAPRLPMCLVFLLAVCSLFAESVKFPDDFPVLVEDPPDNSAAYAMFYQAGLLPVPSNARAVRFGGFVGEGGRRVVHHTQSFGMFPNLPDTWYWQDEDGRGRLLRANRMEEDMAVHHLDSRSRVMPQESGILVMDLDLVRETRNLFDQLIRARDDTRSIRMGFSGPQAAGSQMIFAVRLHETGHTHIANQLTAHLFETTGRRETLLAALSVLVDHEHERNFETFVEDGDLAAFIEATETLLAEKQNVWLKRDIVRELLEEWRESMDAAPGAPENLTESQKQLFDMILGLSGNELSRATRLSHQNWLLTTARMLRLDSGPGEEEGVDFVGAFTQAGAQVIPVLAALAETNRFLPFDARGLSSRSVIHGGRDFERQQMLQTFARPANSGDAAVQILQGVLPRRARARNQDDIIASAMELHTEIQGKSRLEIAWWYLENADTIREAPQAALWTIVASRREEHLERLREAILADADPANILSQLVGTPLMQGEKGLAFKASLPERLQEIYASDLVDPDSWRARSVRELLTRLEAEAAPSIPLERVIEELLANDTGSLQAFLYNPGGLPPTEPGLQRQILPAIARVSSVEQAAKLWQVYQSLSMRLLLHMDMGGMGGMGTYYLAMYSEEETTDETLLEDEKETVLWKPVADLWRPLLENRDTDLGSVLAANAALQLLYRVDQPASFQAMQGFPMATLVHTPPFREQIVAAALGALDQPDGDLGDLLPSVDRIPEDRREVIDSVLENGDSEAMKTLLETRDLSEAIYLSRQLAQMDPDRNPALRQVLNEFSRTMRWIHSFGIDDLPAAAGERVGRETLDALLNRARELALEGKSGSLELVETFPAPGLVLQGSLYHMEHQNAPGVSLSLSGELFYQRRFPLDRTLSLDDPEEKTDSPSGGFDFGAIFADAEGERPDADLDRWLEGRDLRLGRSGSLVIRFAPAATETP